MSDTSIRSNSINPLTPLESVDESYPFLNKQEKTQPTSIFQNQEKRETAELFPNKKRSQSFPEKATENVNFNQNIWSSSKDTQTAAEAPNMFPSPKFEHIQEDPLLHLPKVGGYYIAQIVGKTYELHLIIQEKQLEVFKVTHAGVQKLRDEQIDLVREQIKNEYIEAKWKYWGNILSYFEITTQATIGMGLISSGTNIPLGVNLLTGSALMLTGKLINHFSSHTYSGMTANLSGYAITAYGMYNNNISLGFLDNALPEKIAAVIKPFHTMTSVVLTYEKSKAQYAQLDIKSKQVLNDYERKKNEQKMEQIIDGLGKKEPAQVLAAAAKVISAENQIINNIASGEKN